MFTNGFISGYLCGYLGAGSGNLGYFSGYLCKHAAECACSDEDKQAGKGQCNPQANPEGPAPRTITVGVPEMEGSKLEVDESQSK